MVRYLRNPRVWLGAAAVVMGVVVGLLTNIVTTTPTWRVVGVLVAAVVVLVGLTVVWPVIREEKGRLTALRAARDELLEPMQPALQGTHTISTLLAAEHALAPFVARGTETKKLMRWCLDPAALPVHVLAGPGGVGKSRLAVQVARELPDGWVVGRCASGKAALLLPAVLACQEPTLVIVDDADTKPGVASLVEQLGERAERGEIKVLLLVREAIVFETWLHQQLPDAQRVRFPTTTLAAVGGPGDRRRWFVEAARAYAAALDVPPPPVSDVDTRPVGAEGDPMIIMQVRAVLAALAGTHERADVIRTAGIDRVAAGLIEHERQRWDRAAGDPRWSLPEGFTVEDREEALLVLVLLAPTTFDAAAGVLRRLPLFHEQPEGSLRHIVRWAHHLYPGAGAAQVDPTPDFLRDALLAGLALPAHAELTELLLSALSTQDGQDGAGALRRLIRAAALFATVAPLIGEIVHSQPTLVAAAIESLVLTGPAARVVEQRLVGVITPDAVSSHEVGRLLDLLGPTQFAHLRAALQQLAVQRAQRALDEDDAEETRAALAVALHSLGTSLGKELGRHREALDAFDEALRLRRDLATQEPARHSPDLARSLNNLGANLRELGCHQEALDAHEEALQLWRDLAVQQPARHSPDLARSLNSLGASLEELGRHREALDAFDEALRLRRDLATQEPARHTPDLATSLSNLGASLEELGRHREALDADKEALRLRRDLAAQEPARHTPDLATSLNNLGASLRALGRHREALDADEEALRLWRDLATQEPARHTPDLAASLNNLGVSLWKLGCHQEALDAHEEALRLWRGLATQEPARHSPHLAGSLTNLGISLRELGRHQEALDADEESLRLRRDLAAQEPARHTPDLAASLNNLGASLLELGRHREALDAFEEALRLRRGLAAHEPARHTPDLAKSLTNWAIGLCGLGRHDEELELRTEAVMRWRILARLDPDQHEGAYQLERNRLAGHFAEHNREPDAASRAEEDFSHRLGLET